MNMYIFQISLIFYYSINTEVSKTHEDIFWPRNVSEYWLL